ncbi:C45 family autoproteolytic acyltransferase/hydolase [Paraliobacillus sp. JSM ZJ581]|uniref:C45 family autoproteolytic acyltransferase/hydolase n=1 Tax=Paraliobacillus sp. JSM ZJ581 TaxID=3342118 RepID=UPI0035A95E40
MKTYYSDVIQFRGDHGAFGFQQGEWLRNSPLYTIYTNQSATKKSTFTVDQQKALDWLSYLLPNFIEELKGLAEGLKLSLDQTITHFSGYQQEWKDSGCSILSGDHFVVRNYDYHPKTYEGRFVLYQPNQGYATIGPSQRIIGRTDGMNEKGLVVGYNFVNRRNAGNGFIPTVITRIILEQCQSNEEAIALIKQIPHRFAFNYVLADKHGARHIVEATAQAIRVKENRFSTNHFDMLSEFNRYHLNDSKRRLDILKNQSPSLSITEAYQLFNNTEKDIFSIDYTQSAGTLHTTLYDMDTAEVGIALGSNRLPTMIAFNDWMSGKDIWITKMLGKINTTEHMPYMKIN